MLLFVFLLQGAQWMLKLASLFSVHLYCVKPFVEAEFLWYILGIEYDFLLVMRK
jgi:hypothetical protein